MEKTSKQTLHPNKIIKLLLNGALAKTRSVREGRRQGEKRESETKSQMGKKTNAE